MWLEDEHKPNFIAFKRIADEIHREYLLFLKKLISSRKILKDAQMNGESMAVQA